jgi:hypothetical protein
MKRATMLLLVNLAAVLPPAGTLAAQMSESLFGNWKMNPAKSKFSPGPIPKSSTAKWEHFPGGARLIVDVVPVNGETQHWESSGKFDGSDNPIKGNNPDADTMAVSKIDARTYEIAWKSSGKKTLTARIVVAADGKTRVTTQTGTNIKGESVHNTMFYEKQ